MNDFILFGCLILMTLVGSFASFFLKKATDLRCFVMMIKNHYIYIGGGLYVIAALVNVYVLKYLDYTIVLPLTSLTYIWTMFISYWILNESLNKYKIFGVILIIIGSLCIVIKF